MHFHILPVPPLMWSCIKANKWHAVFSSLPPLSFLMCACVKWHAVSFQLTLSLAGALTSSGRTPFPQDSLQQGSLSPKASHTQTRTRTQKDVEKPLRFYLCIVCCQLLVQGMREWGIEKNDRMGLALFRHLTCVCVCVSCDVWPSFAVRKIFNAAERDVTRRAVTLVWPSLLSWHM